MRAILYSCAETKFNDIAKQVAEIREYAKRKGWLVVAEESEVVDDFTEVRERFAAVKKMVLSGAADIVVLVGIEHLVEDVLEFASFVDILEECGAQLVITRLYVHVTVWNAASTMQINVLGAFEEYRRSTARSGPAPKRAEIKMPKLKAKKRVGRPSPKMDGVDKALAIDEWIKQTGGRSYAALGSLLGGVSATTAYRIAKKLRPEPETLTIDD